MDNKLLWQPDRFVEDFGLNFQFSHLDSAIQDIDESRRVNQYKWHPAFAQATEELVHRKMLPRVDFALGHIEEAYANRPESACEVVPLQAVYRPETPVSNFYKWASDEKNYAFFVDPARSSLTSAKSVMVPRGLES